MATLCLLGACFLVILGLSTLKDDIDHDHRTEDLLTIQRFLSLIIAFIIFLVNFVLRMVIRYFTNYEKHATKTDYQVSVAFKLTVAMFFNSAIIPFLVDIQVEDWFTRIGLCVDAFYMMLVFSILSPFTYIFSPDYVVKKFKRWKIEWAGKTTMSQKEANL